MQTPSRVRAYVLTNTLSIPTERDNLKFYEVRDSSVEAGAAVAAVDLVDSGGTRGMRVGGRSGLDARLRIRAFADRVSQVVIPFAWRRG